MTFAEKLIRLRKREGWSQEALAESLGVSRQAVSRWEQGTALPDAGKLLPCAKLFGVSVDWILDDGQDWEAKSQAAAPAKKPGLLRTILWSILIGISLLGVLLLGILSRSRVGSCLHRLGGFFEILSFGVAVCPVLPGSSCGYSGAAAAPAAEENR